VSKRTVTLSIDPEVYGEYKKHCEENCFVISKKVERFMKEELKK